MYLLLLPCLFLFLFCLYILSHDDFTFLRKNISLEQIFNIAFLGSLVGLFGARLVYVLENLNSAYLNPLVFLVFPYFPGLSLVGGVVAGVLFVTLYTARHKISTERLFDFVCTSLLIPFTFGFLVLSVLEFISQKHVQPFYIVSVIAYIVLSIVFFTVLLPRLRNGELQEGSMGYLFLSSFSLLSIILEIFDNTNKIVFFLSLDGIISIVVFVISLIFLIKQERLLSRVSRLRKG